jgi:hypothetical protein
LAEDRSIADSYVTIKWWGILVFVGLLFGFFFMTVVAHENRITKLETTVDVKLTNLDKNVGLLLELHFDKSKPIKVP